MKKVQTNLTIVQNEKIGKSFFMLTAQADVDLPTIFPAQFAELRIENSPSTFLRRPISIHDVDYDKNTVKFLVKIAGNGTEVLSHIKEGDTLNAVLPLGNTYTIPDDGKILLLGGGVGVAPLFYTAKYLNSFGVRPDIVLGYRNRACILRQEEYEKLGTVHYSTDDGSYGDAGTVMQNSIFMLDKFPFTTIMACGPEPMMRALAKWAQEHNVNCEVSLENKMACGIGVCLCCVQNTKNGHKCVCSEGPVFNVKDLLW